MAKITIDRGNGYTRLNADAVRTIHEGILQVLEKLGKDENIVKVITVQPWQTKGQSQYLKGKIVLREPALALGGNGVTEFEDEFFLGNDTAAYVYSQILLKITHMGGLREGQYRRQADWWNKIIEEFKK